MQLSDFGVKLTKTTLNNGLPLVVFERPEMPISIKVAFFNGSRFDPVGKEGLAHFAEHMLVSGTEKYPTKRDLGLFIEGLGASFNASTSSDKMDVYVDYALREDSQAVVDLLDQFLQHSLFDPETIERERGAIRAELAGKKSDPGVYIYRLWKQVAYQENPLARDTIGSDESISNIDSKDLLQYYTDQLTRNRGIIVASGDITADYLSELFNQSEFVAKRTFSEELVAESTRTRLNPMLIKNYPGSEQAHVAFGFPTIAEDHEDFWPLLVLSRILGSGRASRLNQKLRNEKGLVYAVGSGMDSWFGVGSMVTYTSCKKSDVQKVLDVITDEIQSIASAGVTEEELVHKKNHWEKSQRLRMQTSSAWVGYHTEALLLYPDLNSTVDQDIDHINSVTTQQIKSVAQKYFQKDSWYLAICGDVEPDEITVDY